MTLTIDVHSDEHRFCGRTWDEWKRLSPVEHRRLEQERDAEIARKRREEVRATVERIKAEQLEREREVKEMLDAEKRLQLENMLRRSYLAAGGTEDEFNSVKDELIAQHIADEAIAKLAADRDAIRRSMRSAF